MAHLKHHKDHRYQEDHILWGFLLLLFLLLCISYPFLFVIYMFSIMELLFWRKSTFENPFAQTFQIFSLCIYTGPHKSLFYFSCLLYVIIVVVSICWYLPHSIKRFYVAQVFYFALNTSETFISSARIRADVSKKWNLHQTSDHSTETNRSSLTVDHFWVKRVMSAWYSVDASDRVKSIWMHWRKKIHLIHFFVFYCKLLFDFFVVVVVEKKIVFTCGFSNIYIKNIYQKNI